MKSAYGAHVLISAIKYLDGTHNGSEGTFTQAERRAAIQLLASKLSRSCLAELRKERQYYWGLAK
jgi:hypothetical protein